jgi:drug/metabolite transporter (DMT)-like permease
MLGRRPGIALALVLAAACWGGGTAISKQAVAEVPPITLLAVQLAAGLGFLALVLRARGERLPRGREGRILGRLGLLNPGLAYALSLAGLTQITASLSVLLWAFEPLAILALAAVILRESVGPGIAAGSAVALTGLALSTFEPAVGGSLGGVLLTVAGVLVCAIYTVATRRWLPGSTDSTLGVVFLQQAYALAFVVVVVAAAGITGQPVLPAAITAAGIASAVASGLLYYALAYAFYLSALRAVPASVAAASFYLIPVFGIAAAWLFGERLQPLQWIGAALVIGAVAAITGLRRERPAPATAPA